MRRGRLLGDGRTAMFAPDESVTNTQVYVTLGRRVVNNDADGSSASSPDTVAPRLCSTRTPLDLPANLLLPGAMCRPVHPVFSPLFT